jgi:hypothetical protein
MTYTDLVTAIKQITENAETTFVSSIPMFVKQAENRIYNTVLFPALRKNVTGVMTSGNKYVQCPADFLATSALAVVDSAGAYEYLINKDVNFIRQAYPTPTSTGLPQYYALFGPRSDSERELTFILGPTPNADYTLELHYFYYPSSIVDAGASWLGENFDSVLLYGALVEAAIFMKAEADIYMAYDSKFKEALELARRLGEGLERSDTYRTGEPRVAVSGFQAGAAWMRQQIQGVK